MSFTDYLGTLGAKRVPIGMNTAKAPTFYDSTNRNGDYYGYALSKRDIPYGAQVGGLNQNQTQAFRGNWDNANNRGTGFDAPGYSRPGTGSGFTSGFVDDKGGFLGYGNTLGDLYGGPANNQYTEQLINEPVRQANLETQRIANQQAALNLQRSREARRAAESNNPQFTGAGLVGMGQQGMAPQQMAPQQFGRAAVSGMGRGTGQGLLGGLHRGAAPTGGGQ